MDLLFTGHNYTNGGQIVVFDGNVASFTANQDIVLTGILQSAAAWGDYGDNDGDLDIIIGGVDTSGTVITKVYINRTTSEYVVMDSPTNFNSTVTGNSAILEWNIPSESRAYIQNLSCYEKEW